MEIEDFRKLVGTDFTIRFEDMDPVVLRLESVGNSPPSGGGRADPFALNFEGPADRVLAQGTYEMSTENGDLLIFIVPIGPHHETGQMRYEAIFN